MNKADKKFDAIKVPLAGTNLIEASAGTGKTYSIAVLVLRLIIEKNIPLKEILMVTYTKAAVAELQERIRRFVRDAYKFCKGEIIEDETIKEVVNENKLLSNINVEDNLKNAVFSLDETSVLTIHSFCQQSLIEFAFETKQIFGAEAQTDFSSAIIDEVNQFWRKNVTSIPVGVLKPLLQNGLSIKSLKVVITTHFGGKGFYAYAADKDYNFCDTDFKKWENELNEISNNRNLVYARAKDYIISNKESIRKKCEENSNAKRYILLHIDNIDKLFETIREKSATQYVQKLFADLIEFAEEIDELNNLESNSLTIIKNNIYCLAIATVFKGVENYKKENNLYAFDDMILNLHSALMSADKAKIISALQKKYQAVFVDEFQDTDRMQYEIFREAFMEKSIVFFIGDPKQSIYTFRNADITTYFEAKKSVDNIYGMNTNFRSSDIYTKGLNNFFGIEDPFFFKDCAGELKYTSVEAPPEKANKLLKHQQNPDFPFSLFKYPTKDEIAIGVAGLVNTLLDGKRYFICKDGEEKQIVPSDIGILVRGKKEGRKIKGQLAMKGIPAVTVDEQKVLQTAEAEFLYYLLLAMDNFSLQNINQALLNPITGINSADILNISEEKCVELFKNYREKWDEDGLYRALMAFAADFDIRRRLTEKRNEGGE
ncbi:MAG: UvrD-helicase domain-containing protein, partial [Ferruginibacter sp.]